MAFPQERSTWLTEKDSSAQAVRGWRRGDHPSGPFLGMLTIDPGLRGLALLVCWWDEVPRDESAGPILCVCRYSQGLLHFLKPMGLACW